MVGGKLFMCLVKHFMKLMYMSSMIFEVQVALAAAATLIEQPEDLTWYCQTICDGCRGKYEYEPKTSTCKCTVSKEMEDRQSPINVDTATLQTALVPPLEWCFFGYHPRSVSLMSNGETIRVNFDQKPVPKLRGGPLEGTYQLNHVHFHWSDEDDTGSEHLLNGEGFPMEMHAVFTKGKLTLDEALNVSDGLAVIGYFVEIDDDSSHDPRHPSAMDIITSSFRDLHQQDSPIRIPPFPSKRLLHKFTKGYVTYHGSLTTPNYTEVVVWILAPYTVKITEDELQSFRGLYPRRLMDHAENVRPVQPVNGRPVYLARVWRHKDVPHSTHATHNLYQKTMFGDDYFEYMYSCRTVGTKARVRVGCNNYTNYYFNDDVQSLSEPARNRICALHSRDEMPLVFGDKSLLYGKDLKGFFGPLTLPLDTIDRC